MDDYYSRFEPSINMQRIISLGWHWFHTIWFDQTVREVGRLLSEVWNVEGSRMISIFSTDLKCLYIMEDYGNATWTGWSVYLSEVPIMAGQSGKEKKDIACGKKVGINPGPSEHHSEEVARRLLQWCSWGITNGDKFKHWQKDGVVPGDGDRTERILLSSAGIRRRKGKRLSQRLEEITKIEQGESLFAQPTNPAWARSLPKIRLSIRRHLVVLNQPIAAIVCREYGVPVGHRHRNCDECP